MKNLNELKERKNELQGGIVLEFVAGTTISDMLTAEKQTVEKINFIAKKAELARQGKPFVLVAEPGRETMEEAIVNFCKEQARQKRQAEFLQEVYTLHDTKLMIEAAERIEADPRVARIRRIIESVSDADLNYVKEILVDSLTGFTKAEKMYIFLNILDMDMEDDDKKDDSSVYWYKYNITCDSWYKNGVIAEDCEAEADSWETFLDEAYEKAYAEAEDNFPEEFNIEELQINIEITDSDDPDCIEEFGL